VLLSVHYGETAGSGKSQENSRSRFLDLDATGPGINLDVADVFDRGRIDNAQAAGLCITISSLEVFCGRIIGKLIRIITDRQVCNELKGIAIINLASSVAAIVNK
jgi:hypothetical protein